MRVIRRFARAVAEKFRPEKIILFGSHAYGTPNADSDVDILVVMPARNKHSQAVKIRGSVRAPFPMDLIVRTAAEVQRRLADGDLFHTEIVSRGKVLYESGDMSRYCGTRGVSNVIPRHDSGLGLNRVPVAGARAGHGGAPAMATPRGKSVSPSCRRARRRSRPFRRP
jgi:predicted nucleotidyltransferase